MDNKLIRYCIIESKCWQRIAVLLLLISVILGQLWYQGAQDAKFITLQVKGALIARIADMESELKAKAQLAAFRNEENSTFGSVRFTKISGVAIHGGKPSVLIDGTVYAEGGSFGEFVIVTITQEMITLVNKKTNARKNLYVFEGASPGIFGEGK